jgi:hypothetical protein
VPPGALPIIGVEGGDRNATAAGSVDELIAGQVHAHVPGLPPGFEKDKIAGLQLRAPDALARASLPVRIAGEVESENTGIHHLRQPRAVDSAAGGAAPTVGDALPGLRLGSQVGFDGMSAGPLGRSRRGGPSRRVRPG